MREGISRLKNEIRNWEDESQDWKLKWGNERRNIEIEKWNEEMRRGLSRL
jgi:hypothetical protein